MKYEELYNLKELSKLCKVSVFTIKEYMRMGFLKPEVASKARHVPNMFSIENAVHLCIFTKLSKIGFHRNLVAKMLDYEVRK